MGSNDNLWIPKPYTLQPGTRLQSSFVRTDADAPLLLHSDRLQSISSVSGQSHLFIWYGVGLLWLVVQSAGHRALVYYSAVKHCSWPRPPFLFLLKIGPSSRLFGRIKGLRTEDGVHCTDYKAHWGNLMYFWDRKNFNNLIWKLQKSSKHFWHQKGSHKESGRRCFQKLTMCEDLWLESSDAF